MTPDTQLSIAFIISIASISFTAISFFTNRKKDIKNENEQLIRISVLLEEIQKTINETKKDISVLNTRHQAIMEDLVDVKAQIKDLWRHVDVLEKRQ